jgi:hypothetical protein
MARYNTSQTANTSTGATTIGAPSSGYIQSLTGTAPYTVTIPDPRLYPGIEQVYYNATTGTGIVTLSTPSGNFVGGGSSGSGSQAFNTGSTITVVSDGTNYIITNEDGGPLFATTGQFSGTLTAQSAVSLSPVNANVTISPTGSGIVTIAPGSASTMDRVAVGGTTPAAGAFTTLGANSQVTFTAGTTSSTTGTGTIVVTGGVGVSGQVTAATVSATTVSGTTLTGTLSTGAQTNITSVGTLSNLQVTAIGVGAANSTAGTLTTTGNAIIGGTITVNSDASLKTNVTTITNALEKVLALRGVMYDRIANNNHEMGVIAQEVEAIIPELVITNEHGIKSVAYANTVALLIEAIKEQQLQIDELKGK